ncbi:MAG TPA: hypothetical protein VLL52_00990 [Anaerolineae bacterium]|nr:hypothetical protein [Anaerolineae bacterium]
MSIDKNDQLYITWLDNDHTIAVRKLSANNEKRWIELDLTLKPEQFLNSSSNPSLSVDSHGDLYMVWRGSDFRGDGITIAQFHNDSWQELFVGSTYSPGISYTSFPFDHMNPNPLDPTIVIDGEDTIYVAWHMEPANLDDRDTYNQLYVRRYRINSD